ncbi:hypothetical protein OsJ_10566 [Oryza sativa Japonica Group]|uniref:Uncharacterized protein n=1 Tax=Oryza sativa subsp. japonica TaxID=39947 RepID=B9F7Y3_ORYSJ|nr:hypothetical protein OsJ_10566 [Oryza sativa Japonica Group]
MCGDCCGRGAGGAAEAGAAGAGGGRKRGCAGTALALVALAAAAAVAVLEGTAGGVSYVGDGWLHECAKWDADGRRLLVSNFFGAGVSELRAEAKGKEKEEERVVLADPDVAGRVALGLTVDAPRGRLLIVYADRLPRFAYSAVAAYDLASWRRLFLTRLDGPAAKSGKSSNFHGTMPVVSTAKFYPSRQTRQPRGPAHSFPSLLLADAEIRSYYHQGRGSEARAATLLAPSAVTGARPH